MAAAAWPIFRVRVRTQASLTVLRPGGVNIERYVTIRYENRAGFDFIKFHRLLRNEDPAPARQSLLISFGKLIFP